MSAFLPYPALTLLATVAFILTFPRLLPPFPINMLLMWFASFKVSAWMNRYHITAVSMITSILTHHFVRCFIASAQIESVRIHNFGSHVHRRSYHCPVTSVRTKTEKLNIIIWMLSKRTFSFHLTYFHFRNIAKNIQSPPTSPLRLKRGGW